MNDRLMKGAPPGSVGIPSPNGWMDNIIFVKYLQHFIQHVKPSETNKCLVIFDGHASHKSLDAINLAKENHITLITIPPHTSHRLQPLDVSFFGPLKSRYNRELDKWMVANPGKRVTQFDVAELFAHAYESTASIDKAKTGFQKTGIFPYNPHVFTNEDYLCSAVTDRPDTVTDSTDSMQVDVVNASTNEQHASIVTTSGVGSTITERQETATPSSDAIQIDIVNQATTERYVGLSVAESSDEAVVSSIRDNQMHISTDLEPCATVTTTLFKPTAATPNCRKTKVGSKKSLRDEAKNIAGRHIGLVTVTKPSVGLQARQKVKPVIKTKSNSKKIYTGSVVEGGNCENTAQPRSHGKNKAVVTRPPVPVHLRQELPRLPKWHSKLSATCPTLQADSELHQMQSTVNNG